MAQITADFREAALRRGIVVKSSKSEGADHLISAAAVEMANLGFLVEPAELKGMDAQALSAMLEDARKLVGADRAMDPIYPGFPAQVKDLSTARMLAEQIFHYLSHGYYLPDYPTVVRKGLPLEDMVRGARKVTVLPAAATARELTRSLTLDPLALSEDERTLLKGCVELQMPTLEAVAELSRQARHGENLQSFISAVHSVGNYTPRELLAAALPGVSTADHLLRLVLAVLSAPAAEKWEANYRLAVTTLADSRARAVRMGKVDRPTRRLILARLGELTPGFKADSLVGRQGLWRRVCAAIHPYDLKPTAAEKRALDIVHSNGEYRTLNSSIEQALEAGAVQVATELLEAHRPGELLRRLVALLRLTTTVAEARSLAGAVERVGAKAQLTTLISSYNGVLSANDEATRVTRVAGLTNTMVERKAVVKVKESYRKLVLRAVETALREKLKHAPKPEAPVGVADALAMPLVKRDASTADRTLFRGEELAPVGDGDVLRIFSHWKNTQTTSGYMDVGATLLDGDLQALSSCGWNSWSDSRAWATYSGDKHVHPGDTAAEFVDVELAKVREFHPQAEWIVMSIDSWSGWPVATVDIIAGVMLRSAADEGETFDARAVTSAFKPTTEATHSAPLAVEVKTGKVYWLDSSNGSQASGTSAADDTTLGSLVYDELLRPRLTVGELARLWAEAHGVAVAEEQAADREAVMALLG